ISIKFFVYVVAVVIGCGFGYMYIFLRKKLMRLESNGAVNLADAIGREADVYLRIPAESKGAGKVQISLNGSIFEYPAVTRGQEIATGRRIKVVDVLDNRTLLVEEV
nr:hypothetical protein [Bacteroidaceae bacterium]